MGNNLLDLDALSDQDYLRELAKRLMDIPVTYGTDGGDIDRLEDIANTLDKMHLNQTEMEERLGRIRKETAKSIASKRDPLCGDCGIPRSEAIIRKGKHADTCQNEGTQNIIWHIAHMRGERYIYTGPTA